MSAERERLTPANHLTSEDVSLMRFELGCGFVLVIVVGVVSYLVSLL